MPDILGRYSLSEMRDRTRRVLNASQVNVDPLSGAETGTTTFDPLFSNDDLNFFINTAITSVWCDCILSAETSFSDEQLIDVVKDQSEYPLPDDLAQIRGLYWKKPSSTLTIVPMIHRTFMHLFDESCPLAEINGAPTYRISIDSINLLQPPLHDNFGGILIRYVKHAIFLDSDARVIETQFARIMQEAVIREAAAEALESRGQLDATNIKTRAQEWKQRLILVVRNTLNPPFVQLTPGAQWQRSEPQPQRFMA